MPAVAPPSVAAPERRPDELKEAIRNWDRTSAELLLDAGIDVNAFFTGGDTPLTLAAALGDVGMVKMLLAHNANVNGLNDDGQSALITAAANGKVDVMRILIDAQADLYVTEPIDIEQHTALSRATYFNHKEAVDLLIEAGMDTTVNGDCAAIYYASNPEIKEMLAEAPARQRMLAEVAARARAQMQASIDAKNREDALIAARQQLLRKAAPKIKL